MGRSLPNEDEAELAAEEAARRAAVADAEQARLDADKEDEKRREEAQWRGYEQARADKSDDAFFSNFGSLFARIRNQTPQKLEEAKQSQALSDMQAYLALAGKGLDRLAKQEGPDGDLARDWRDRIVNPSPENQAEFLKPFSTAIDKTWKQTLESTSALNDASIMKAIGLDDGHFTFTSDANGHYDGTHNAAYVQARSQVLMDVAQRPEYADILQHVQEDIRRVEVQERDLMNGTPDPVRDALPRCERTDNYNYNSNAAVLQTEAAERFVKDHPDTTLVRYNPYDQPAFRKLQQEVETKLKTKMREQGIQEPAFGLEAFKQNAARWRENDSQVLQNDISNSTSADMAYIKVGSLVSNEMRAVTEAKKWSYQRENHLSYDDYCTTHHVPKINAAVGQYSAYASNWAEREMRSRGDGYLVDIELAVDKAGTKAAEAFYKDPESLGLSADEAANRIKERAIAGLMQDERINKSPRGYNETMRMATDLLTEMTPAIKAAHPKAVGAIKSYQRQQSQYQQLQAYHEAAMPNGPDAFAPRLPGQRSREV